ncbi:hypothetical protein PILCRDRAFT_173106 [Piloderma croceum F 1598]|uniref:Uncharacterized protein n=1 Tax=Piloderma croceum (strain F 1598) TaxID=765440 RepID=A0A0C3GHM5_PILCF|nr:hypothetical protein PILCRDRAFT_173106 [Piloderma croceum F 1598]
MVAVLLSSWSPPACYEQIAYANKCCHNVLYERSFEPKYATRVPDSLSLRCRRT